MITGGFETSPKQSFSVEQFGACVRVREINSFRTDNNVVIVNYAQGCEIGLRFDNTSDAATAFDLIDLVVNGLRK